MNKIDCDPRILDDFRNFLYVIWEHLGLPPPTPIQYEIAEFLQHGPKRQIIMAFRGVGKSWITSTYVLWSLLRDPEQKFLVVSASKQRADDFSVFTQRLIAEVDILRHLMPTDEQRSSKVAFDVRPARPAHAPSVKSVGVYGQMTGSRATHIIADDVEILNNSNTEDARDKLLQTVLEFEAIIVPEVGRITYLGTPQTESSVYNKLRQRGYTARIWPARYPNPEKAALYEGALSPLLESGLEKDPTLAGKPSDPQRFSLVDLMEREGAYGRSGFALQFMLDTTLSDIERYPLKASDLILLDCDPEKAPVSLVWAADPRYQVQDKALPNVGFTGDRFYRPMFISTEFAPYKGSVMAIDPSGRGKDETTYAVIKQLHGFLFVTALGGFKGGYEMNVLQGLAEIAKAHKVHEVVIESNFGDGMFTSIFAPVLAKVHPCAIDEVRHNIQKERRIIDTLEPVMNRHKLVFDIRVAKEDLKLADGEDIRYSFFYQMTHLTRDRGSLKHDDRLDVLAMAVSYWSEAVSQDEQKALERHKEALLDQQLRDFMEGVHGYSGIRPNNHSWTRTTARKR